MNPAHQPTFWLTAGPPPDEGVYGHDAGGLGPAFAELPVLIVEDEAMIAWMLESLLEDLGFRRIAIAADGDQAVAAAALTAPRLILSDINLGPGRDGVEAVAEIRRRTGAAVVFISAYVDQDARTRIEAQVSGALILSKPVGSEDVASAVRRLLIPDTLH